MLLSFSEKVAEASELLRLMIGPTDRFNPACNDDGRLRHPREGQRHALVGRGCEHRRGEKRDGMRR